MFAVIRDCCTGSSRCTGADHPAGSHVRVEQMRTEDRKRAEWVALNWAAYKAEVVEIPAK